MRLDLLQPHARGQVRAEGPVTQRWGRWSRAGLAKETIPEGDIPPVRWAGPAANRLGERVKARTANVVMRCGGRDIEGIEHPTSRYQEHPSLRVLGSLRPVESPELRSLAGRLQRVRHLWAGRAGQVGPATLRGLVLLVLVRSSIALRPRRLLPGFRRWKRHRGRHPVTKPGGVGRRSRLRHQRWKSSLRVRVWKGNERWRKARALALACEQHVEVNDGWGLGLLLQHDMLCLPLTRDGIALGHLRGPHLCATNVQCGGGCNLEFALSGNSANLGLLACLQLVCRAQVAETALRTVCTTRRLPDPGARLTLACTMEQRATR
mmetsp:Transcript_49321/g.107385  ORF Transcript_49321/g.107385 Transcript_49321/m.107385 type:complete len:321 (+) Transcript_49321:637-1599(+)